MAAAFCNLAVSLIGGFELFGESETVSFSWHPVCPKLIWHPVVSVKSSISCNKRLN